MLKDVHGRRRHETFDAFAFQTMFTQQSVYVLGIVNLLLAALAIVCVVQAQDHREHFFLVYIAVSIFVFYMTTIFVIIILQIMETYQEQQQRRRRRRGGGGGGRGNHQSLLGIEIPLLKTRLNAVMDENLNRPTKPKIYLSRSQTLPLILSTSTSHPHSTTSTLLPTSKGFQNLSGELLSAATTHLTLFTHHHQQPAWSTIHRNYRSFTFITNDRGQTS